MGFKTDVIGKLDKIETKLVEHTVELSKNTHVLQEHHVRSSNLEARFKPIEKHVLVVNSLVKIAIALCAAAGAIVGIIKALN